MVCIIEKIKFNKKISGKYDLKLRLSKVGW